MKDFILSTDYVNDSPRTNRLNDNDDDNLLNINPRDFDFENPENKKYITHTIM